MCFETAKRIMLAGSTAPTILLRGSFSTHAPHAVLRICSDGFFTVWFNGRRLFERGIKSYDFWRLYDEVDLSAGLLPGDNLLAVECSGTLLAEVADGSDVLAVTDENWRVRENPARDAHTLGHSITMGKEEGFDGRLALKGWYLPGYDCTGWAGADLYGGSRPFSHFHKNSTALLPRTPVYGKTLTASLLAQPMPGERLTLLPRPSAASDGRTDTNGSDGSGMDAQVYMTVLVCPGPTALSLRIKNLDPAAEGHLSVDGVLQKSSLSIPLKRGTHLLAFAQFGEAELLLDAPGARFGARTLTGADCRFAALAFAGACVRYPWHERGADVIDSIPEIGQLLKMSDARTVRAQYSPAPAREGGRTWLAEALTTRYFLPQGGYCQPGMFRDLAALPDHPNTVKNEQALLTLGTESCEVAAAPGFRTCLVVDLGREYCGHVALSLEAGEGDEVGVQCFEVIDGNGVFLMGNHNGFRYTCAAGRQDYLSFSRYGCRYLLLSIRTEKGLRILDVHLESASYPVVRHGSFVSSDPLLNRIYEMCVDTSHLCMLDTYVDCPGHEQNFWVGDADITARNNLLNFGEYRFNQQCIAFVGKSLGEDFVRRYFPNDPRYLEKRYLSIGAYDCYPEGGLPMWSFLWVQQCWEHYLYSGELQDLREDFGYVAQNLENACRLLNSRGLFDMPGAWNLIEWGVNDLSPYGEVTVNNIFLVNSFRVAARMAAALGLPERSAEYAGRARTLTENINRLCWDASRGAYVDTVRDAYSYERYTAFCAQNGSSPNSKTAFLACSRISEQTNTLALLYGCVPEERRASVQKIAERVRGGHYRYGAPSERTAGTPLPGETRDGIVSVGSPFFLYFSLGALFAVGETQTALEVIRRDWGGMLEKGVNTCWETFAVSDKTFTRSIAHAWSAGPSVYLLENVLGIRPVQPGYRTFTVRPELGDLQYAHGSVCTPFGPIYVRAEKQPDGTCRIDCQAPHECMRIE